MLTIQYSTLHVGSTVQYMLAGQYSTVHVGSIVQYSICGQYMLAQYSIVHVDSATSCEGCITSISSSLGNVSSSDTKLSISESCETSAHKEAGG